MQYVLCGRQGPRPHIFGMTASPLGQKCDSVNACRHFFRQLEDNLNAQVLRPHHVTMVNLDVLDSVPSTNMPQSLWSGCRVQT